MEAEQGDEVGRRQRDCREPVEVGAVGGIEVKGAHRIGEQRAMHLLGHASAVFIRLDLDQGGLGVTSQARDRPRVGIGFFELISRTVNGNSCACAALPCCCNHADNENPPPSHKARRSCSTSISALGDGKACAQAAFEAAFEISAKTEDLRVPFPLVRHPGETLVVQFIGAIERELPRRCR